MIDWTPPVDRYFIDLILEQMHSGNKVDHSFDDHVWTQMISLFNEKFGPSYDKYVLENRFICLMNQYVDTRNLLNQEGFAWDDTQQIVAAADDAWEAYIKEHPHTISYRGKILEYYKDLSTIFGSVIIDEQVICQSIGTEIDPSFLGMEYIEICGDLQITVAETETSDEGKKRPIITPASGRSSKLQKRGKEDIKEAFSNVANVVSKLVNKQDEKSYIAVERSIDALQAIPDIDDELLLDACDLLEDERKAKTFLALDASLGKKWF